MYLTKYVLAIFKTVRLIPISESAEILLRKYV